MQRVKIIISFLLYAIVHSFPTRWHVISRIMQSLKRNRIRRRKLLLSSLCLVKMSRPWRIMHCKRDAADDIHCWCALVGVGRRPFLSSSRQTFLSTFYFNIFRGFFQFIHVLICYPDLIWWVCPGTQSRPGSLGFVSRNYTRIIIRLIRNYK